MRPEEYIEERVEDQINWYSKKSSLNKGYFLFLKIIEIILASSLPFLSGYLNRTSTISSVTIGLFGVVISIIEGILFVNKFQEKWIGYRSTAETLKHEKYLFLTNTGSYSDATNFGLFVKRVENLISKENSNWNQFIIVSDKEKKDNSESPS